MRWKFIAEICGVLIFFVGIALLFPLGWAVVFRDEGLYPLFYSMVTAVICGGILRVVFRQKTIRPVSAREGMVIVTFGWVAVAFFGAVPFWFSGYFGSIGGAFFESMSGFTTTGSSVLTNIEAVPDSILLWRSFIQWIGGMGIVLFSIAILPFIGVGGMELYKAEVPSPVPDKLKPRLQETAKMLWWVYSIISILQIIALKFGGMSLFDSLCHTFTTMPTGGFSPKNLSVAHYNSVYIDVVITVFMIIAGLNFSLHFQFLRGKKFIFFKDIESRVFLGTILFFSLLIAFDVWGDVYDSFFKAFRYSSFQVVSIITTTGYATADFELWPGMSQLILFIAMFIGACAGSTGGGMKFIRVIIGFKYCYKQVFSLIHPHGVKQIKLEGVKVEDSIVDSILGFILLYIILFAFASLMLSFLGVDFITTISAVASSIGNVGPGLGSVGPTENYSCIPEAGKWLLSFCMLLGRLEIYTVITLFFPVFWKD